MNFVLNCDGYCKKYCAFNNKHYVAHACTQNVTFKFLIEAT